tara:strand:- start:320 stop:1198 length:879 start_codon:yes stop_codon:yes gene_type:complete
MIESMSNDQRYYLEATNEFDEGRLDEALWSKMLSVNNGDETKAKYSYINHRAKELKKEAIKEYFSESFKNGIALIKRMLRPLFILAASALVIYGLIEAINYIRTTEERAAYEQQLEEQAVADAIARAAREEQKRIAAAERREQERIAAAERAKERRALIAERAEIEEKIANAYQGLDCVVEGVSYQYYTTYSFTMILNPMALTVEFVEYTSDGFPEIVEGGINDRETYYYIDPRSSYLGKRRWDKSSFNLNKKDLSIDSYSNSKCTPTDHNEIRERVRKEQESIRSEYKLTN